MVNAETWSMRGLCNSCHCGLSRRVTASALFLLCYLLAMEILNSTGHLLLRIQILECYIVTLALIKLELIIFYLDLHKVSFAVLRTVLV